VLGKIALISCWVLELPEDRHLIYNRREYIYNDDNNNNKLYTADRCLRNSKSLEEWNDFLLLRRIVTLFIRFIHTFASLASWIKSILSTAIFLRSNFTLFCHIRLSQALVPLEFLTKILYFLASPMRETCPSRFNNSSNIWQNCSGNWNSHIKK
jgi:hypothetical protein